MPLGAQHPKESGRLFGFSQWALREIFLHKLPCRFGRLNGSVLDRRRSWFAKEIGGPIESGGKCQRLA
jgi:hypothetical protein